MSEDSQSVEYSLTVKSVFLLVAQVKEDIAADGIEEGQPDLRAHQEGKSIRRMWNFSPALCPVTCITIVLGILFDFPLSKF
jgi:hypothetical protein